MTQPVGKRGPVSPGAAERFGDSAQGISHPLASIQSSARGVGEWIDGLGTGGALAPTYAHDHRGGIWGRPLGVGYSVPMRRAASGFACRTFCNVPDPRNLAGDALGDATVNGGYSFVDVWVYANGGGGGGGFGFECLVSRWYGDPGEPGFWLNVGTQVLNVTGLAAGNDWNKANGGLHLPPGLVAITLRDNGSATDWHWASFVVPQR